MSHSNQVLSIQIDTKQLIPKALHWFATTSSTTSSCPILHDIRNGVRYEFEDKHKGSSIYVIFCKIVFSLPNKIVCY